MKFNGNHVSLSSHEEGITVRMKDKDNECVLFLTNQEGAQLMSFLLSAYGIGEVFYEDGDEEIVPPVKVRH